ncbi:lipid A deacylase LpxR family protein [Polaribacter porphyrae]|uniref:Lipid A deacylase LpxR family protein n=1 Tax=Polaribacter porphyrae TaxID=1137780 RepID=A0A2S7WN96_9FLAO|nr:lipid A deacylase LpxR family protein [Polaribacter porphyrae]PQJ78741.1 hypothetical protein BTO18_05875 [Polaribacter porphyrae]
MKLKLTVLFFFITFSALSQEKFSKEISFINDNDLYVSTERDRYYTNGMFFRYRYLSKVKNEKLEKRIFEWELGHEMFTPNKATVATISEHDRPFAGHLFGKFNVRRVYKNDKILNTSIQLGLIGPDAFGQELQEVIHSIYGFKETPGWKYQINNAFAFNFNAEYIHLLSTNKTNDFDISWISSLRAGTVYTNISSGFYSRVGLLPLAKMANSIAFNTNLNDDSTNYGRAIESFFFIKPTLRYAIYDATLQGSFLNTSSIVTKELIPLVFNLEIGIKFTANRWNFGYTFNYNTSKSKDLRYTYGNKFGTIIFSYLLR